MSPNTSYGYKQQQSIGLSRGGHTSKIHLPVELIVTGGEVHDSQVANELIDLLPQAYFIIADKGYGSEEITDKVRGRNSTPVIPRRKNSKTGNADIYPCNV
ncbi:MAG: transposase [Psychromonas sp.]|nr:transposase [Psychromonas sp.]